MLKPLRRLPFIGPFVIGPILDGGKVVVDTAQGGVNLVVDGAQLLALRGAVNGLQLLLGLG